jgi:hypothetical protein
MRGHTRSSSVAAGMQPNGIAATWSLGRPAHYTLAGIGASAAQEEQVISPWPGS